MCALHGLNAELILSGSFYSQSLPERPSQTHPSIWVSLTNQVDPKTIPLVVKRATQPNRLGGVSPVLGMLLDLWSIWPRLHGHHAASTTKCRGQLWHLLPQATGQTTSSCCCHESFAFFLFSLCPAPLPDYRHASVCLWHLVPTLAHAPLVPIAWKDHRIAHPEVTVPCTRDSCPRFISKQLAPFNDGIHEIICQTLMIISKSPFFKDTNKDLPP